MGFAEGGVSIPSSIMNIAPGDQLALIEHLGCVPSQGNIGRSSKQPLIIVRLVHIGSNNLSNRFVVVRSEIF